MYLAYTLLLLAMVFFGPLLSEGQSYFIAVFSIGMMVGAMIFFALADQKMRAILATGGAVALFLVATGEPSGLEALIVLWVAVFIFFSSTKRIRTKPDPENPNKPLKK